MTFWGVGRDNLRLKSILTSISCSRKHLTGPKRADDQSASLLQFLVQPTRIMSSLKWTIPLMASDGEAMGLWGGGSKVRPCWWVNVDESKRYVEAMEDGFETWLTIRNLKYVTFLGVQSGAGAWRFAPWRSCFLEKSWLLVGAWRWRSGENFWHLELGAKELEMQMLRIR